MSVVRVWDAKDTIDGGLQVWHEEPVMHGEQHAHHHVSHVLLLPRGLLVSRLHLHAWRGCYVLGRRGALLQPCLRCRHQLLPQRAGMEA
jgi:hypothetical protein